MNQKYLSICVLIIFLSVVFTIFTAGLTCSPKADVPTVEVSDEALVKAQEGNYSLKVSAVYDAVPETLESDAPEAERVVIVVYEYKNVDISHGLAIGSTHFKAYDSNGKELEQYPQKDLFEPGEVGKSETFTASVAFALNNSENYVKVEYYNDTATKTPDAVFEKEW